MTFPNAYQGIRKIFSAEILNLIASVCLFVSMIFGIAFLGSVVTDNATAGITGGIGFVVLMAASGVLAIIAMILKLVGLKRAGIDDERFNTAFIFAIFALILTVVTTVLSTWVGMNGFWDDLVRTITTLFELFVTIYIVNGIQSLADQLGRDDMVAKGRTYYILFLIVYILRLIASIVPVFFGTNPTTGTISSIVGLIGAVLSMITYILYLILLGRAKKMLRTQ